MCQPQPFHIDIDGQGAKTSKSEFKRGNISPPKAKTPKVQLFTFFVWCQFFSSFPVPVTGTVRPRIPLWQWVWSHWFRWRETNPVFKREGTGHSILLLQLPTLLAVHLGPSGVFPGFKCTHSCTLHHLPRPWRAFCGSLLSLAVLAGLLPLDNLWPFHFRWLSGNST